VFNGWDALPDVNTGLSYMGRIGIALGSNDTIGVVGYGGPEQTTVSLGGSPGASTGNWREGVDVVLNHKFTDKFNSYVQLDYGHEDNAFLSDALTQTANADWYAAGLWLVYDFTDKVELAFRQDYLKDKDGVRTGSTFGLPAGIGPELYSSTLTLNYKPIANVQIRPEVRWDHSDQFTLGMGVAYLF
jgi:hypothetical protein